MLAGADRRALDDGVGGGQKLLGGGFVVAGSPIRSLCVPITSSTSCDQAIFVDQATDLSLSSDAALVEIDRLG